MELVEEKIPTEKWKHCWKVHISRVSNGFVIDQEDEEKIVTRVLQENENSFSFQSEREEELELFKNLCYDLADYFGIELYNKYAKKNLEIEITQNDTSDDD